MFLAYINKLAKMQKANGTTNNLSRKQHHFSMDNFEKCKVFVFIPP